MSNLISGNNARSGDDPSYSGGNGRVSSSAGVAVLPKKKAGTVKRGKAAAKKKKSTAGQAASAAKAAIKSGIRKDRRVRYAYVALLIAAVTLIAFAIIVFSGRVSYYTEHFYEGTVINGVDISEMTLAEAGGAMQRMADDYTLTITDFEGRSYYAGAAVFGLTYEDDGTLENILAGQTPILWPFKKGRAGEYDISGALNVNRGSLEAWVSCLDCAGEAVMPQDAYLTTDADGYYYIEPEVCGNTVDLPKMYDIVENAIRTGVPFIDMTDPDTFCYLTPSVYATDPELHARMASLNEDVYAAKVLESRIRELTDVTVVLAGQFENYVLDPSNLTQWIRYDDEGEPYLETNEAYAWVDAFAAANGLTGSTNLFRTHDGYIVTVDQGPFSGWTMDTNATAKAVADALETKTSGTVYPVMISADGIAQQDDSYIEIDLTDQMMWYFRGGEVLVETPIVSGNVVADLETPSYGVWTVDGKYTSYLMMAPLNEDGTRDYETVVNYWIPFNNDIGIHDLANREYFGGDIYIWDGSHGCINTPLDKVAQIYDLVDTGTKVVVYGS